MEKIEFIIDGIKCEQILGGNQKVNHNFSDKKIYVAVNFEPAISVKESKIPLNLIQENDGYGFEIYTAINFSEESFISDFYSQTIINVSEIKDDIKKRYVEKLL